MPPPVVLQSSDGDYADAALMSGHRKPRRQTCSVSPPELDLPLHPVKLVIEALHFAGKFVDGLDEVLNDIVVRALLLRLAKKNIGS
jgi:hypothetical protein